MNFKNGLRAVSTLIIIILILASLVIGALITYVWTIAPFYLEPSDTVDLVITDVNFPVDNASHFDFTIMNPSHSVSGTVISDVYVTAAGIAGRYNVSSSDPLLPMFLDKGTTESIRCESRWSGIAGKTLTVHVTGQNGSGASRSFKSQFVELEVDANFNATQSVKDFNVTVKNNAASAINLTLKNVLIDFNPVSNVTISFPRTIQTNETVKFDGFFDWRGYAKPTVRVETIEGYYGEAAKEVSSVVDLQVANVTFNESNSTEVGVTLHNWEQSATAVDVTAIILTRGNVTESLSLAGSSPSPLPCRLDKGGNATFNCVWNWTDRSYRNKNINITAETRQGFTAQTLIGTPQEVAARIDDVKLDLDDTEHLTVNVTNLAYSLQTINVTAIDFNPNSTVITPTLLSAGAQAAIQCSFNWTSFLRANASVTVYFTYGANQSTIQFYLTVPYLKVENASFSNFALGNPYVNVTVMNSPFSRTNATITRVLIRTANATFALDGTITSPKIPLTTPLVTGAEMTLTGLWDSTPYIGEDVTVIVQTADGLQASATFRVA